MNNNKADDWRTNLLRTAAGRNRVIDAVIADLDRSSTDLRHLNVAIRVSAKHGAIEAALGYLANAALELRAARGRDNG